MTRRNEDQRRGAHALARVRLVLEKKNPALSTAFRGLTRELPALVRINRLGQAVVLYGARCSQAQDEPHFKPARAAEAAAYQHVLASVTDWLCGEGNARLFQGTDLCQAVLHASRERYFVAQLEALAYLDWLKTMAAGLLPDGAADSTVAAANEQSTGVA